MRDTLVTIFALALLTACVNDNSGVKDQGIQKSAFEQFIDSIPILELPYELSTSDEMKHLDITSGNIPEGAALIGRLPSIENVQLLIYSYPADIRLPMLEIYDNDGKKLNQVQLFDYNCPLTSIGHSKFLIEENHVIYKETVCDAYDSRIDRDTIKIEGLLKND